MTDMTLEQVRDWHRITQIDCQQTADSYKDEPHPAYQEMADEHAQMGAVIDSAITSLAAKDAEIAKLTAERDAWRKLVLSHNAECERLCKDRNCGYKIYLEKCGRRCPRCTLYDVIEIPPELQP